MKLDINTQIEEWKDIKGYEGLYQVSDMGRVKSLERTVIDKIGRKQLKKERILKLRTNHSGYLLVDLYKSNSKRKTFKVHRLVCEAFYKNPKNKPCVNHIDENKANNTVSNLEWCTYAENNNHGTHNVRMAKSVAKANSKPVGQYTQNGKLIKVWQSARKVQRLLGFDQGYICKAANGKKKTAYGYVWKYVEKVSSN